MGERKLVRELRLRRRRSRVPWVFLVFQRRETLVERHETLPAPGRTDARCREERDGRIGSALSGGNRSTEGAVDPPADWQERQL